MGLDPPQIQHSGRELDTNNLRRETPSTDCRLESLEATESGCKAGERGRERDGEVPVAGYGHGLGDARRTRVQNLDGRSGLNKGDWNTRSHSQSDNGSCLEMEYPTDDNLNDDEETGLTTQQRKQRGLLRRKRREETDGREVVLSVAQKHLADKAVVRRLAVNVMFILLWYLFSVSISLVCPDSLTVVSGSVEAVADCLAVHIVQ